MIDLPRVTIIVLNWNGRDDTLACLSSLSELDYPSYEIVVVDNGSGDDSVEAIRASFPRVTLVETGENLGYVGGNNLGLEYARAAKADYALLLNNDTEVAPDFVHMLVDAAQAGPDIGIAGPVAGLLVAIPATLIYNALVRRVDVLTARWNSLQHQS